MEAVAAGDEVAGDLAGLARSREGDARPRAVEIVDRGLLGLEQDRPVIGEPPGDQVLHHFLLAIDGDCLAAGQLPEVEAVPMLADLDLDALMHEAFALEPRIEAGFPQGIDAALLEHAGAHPVLHIGAAARLDDDRSDALKMQEMRQQQSRWTRPYDADLRALAHHLLPPPLARVMA